MTDGPLLVDPQLLNTGDVHGETLKSDAAFHRWMEHLVGPDWREKLTPTQQRMHAKSWNFGRLYGNGRPFTADDVDKVIKWK